eukprot:jgi/Chlat1/8114/Chrsp75S07570
MVDGGVVGGCGGHPLGSPPPLRMPPPPPVRHTLNVKKLLQGNLPGAVAAAIIFPMRADVNRVSDEVEKMKATMADFKKFTQNRPRGTSAWEGPQVWPKPSE